MAYKTFTAGEILTAADVMTYLMNQVVVVCTSGTRPSSPAEGRVIFETDTDRTMVYDGASWTELGMLSPPHAFVTRAATQSYTTGATTAMSFDTEVTDVGNMWTSGSATRLTVPSGAGGFYVFGGMMEFQGNVTGNRQVLALVSGAERVRQTIPSIGAGLTTRVEVMTGYQLIAGNYIELQGRQDSGSSLTVTGQIWAVRVCA